MLGWDGEVRFVVVVSGSEDNLSCLLWVLCLVSVSSGVVVIW